MGRGLGMGGECGGGVSTRESMNHCHTPYTPSGTKGGGVQRKAQCWEWQLKVCHLGKSWMRRKDLLIHQT